jgi:hypothetical protein
MSFSTLSLYVFFLSPLFLCVLSLYFSLLVNSLFSICRLYPSLHCLHPLSLFNTLTLPN